MIVSCHAMTIGYGSKALARDLHFAVKAGEICAVVGPNGAGKSTFLKTLLGLQPALKGAVTWQGEGAPTRAYLGQTDEFDSQFPIRVRDLVAMGAWHGLGFWSHVNGAKQQAVEDALAQTKITSIADQPLHECSAGQLQRCLFARAIVQDAPLLLLDEPFTAMDQTTQANLLEIIESWRQQGRGQIIVLHDLNAVRALTDTVLLIGQGESCFGKTQEVLTKDNLVKYGYYSPMQAAWLEEGAIS